MGIRVTGNANVNKPTRCNWCGRKSTDLVKVHSSEDRSTLRICRRHWTTMASHPREFGMWVAVAFPKWDRKVHRNNRDEFLLEARHFVKTEREVEKLFGECDND